MKMIKRSWNSNKIKSNHTRSDERIYWAFVKFWIFEKKSLEHRGLDFLKVSHVCVYVPNTPCSCIHVVNGHLTSWCALYIDTKLFWLLTCEKFIVSFLNRPYLARACCCCCRAMYYYVERAVVDIANIAYEGHLMAVTFEKSKDISQVI